MKTRYVIAYYFVRKKLKIMKNDSIASLLTSTYFRRAVLDLGVDHQFITDSGKEVWEILFKTATAIEDEENKTIYR